MQVILSLGIRLGDVHRQTVEYVVGRRLPVSLTCLLAVVRAATVAIGSVVTANPSLRWLRAANSPDSGLEPDMKDRRMRLLDAGAARSRSNGTGSSVPATERLRLGPGPDDQLERFLEPVSRFGGIGGVGDVLVRRPAQHAGESPGRQ